MRIGKILKRYKRIMALVMIVCLLTADAMSFCPVFAQKINERLAVEITAGRNGERAESGETLYAKVVSRYSKANNPNQNVGVAIQISELPQGVSIAGFTDGVKQVTYADEENKEHNIFLQLVEEDGGTYIKFEQPAGATLEFEVQFNSSNGIMENGASVTLSVDSEKVTGLDTPVGDNDFFSEPLTLTWNADNEWDAVDKKVNNADSNEIAVRRENKLSGELTYTIEANSSNREDFGEIWTDYIQVTDTLTLPENISFPEGARVSDDKTAIIDDVGKEIFYFSNMQQGGSVTELTLEEKRVTYTVQIPNIHKENGIPVQEQDNLSLELKLNANLLVLAEGYCDKSSEEMKKDVIENKVAIQPVPYQTYDVKGSEDKVTTVPTSENEVFIVEKEADKEVVQAGDTVNYTLSVENTGIRPIRVQEENGEFYKVTDELPEYLYLTSEQIAMLPEEISYDERNAVISWIPGRTDIAPGEKRQVSFSVTVRDAQDDVMQTLSNGTVIRNVAQYKGIYSDAADIIYRKAEVRVEKTSKDEDGDGKASNGERITYTLTIVNDTDLNTVMEEVIKDDLPEGLEFVSAAIGNNRHITESGTYLLHGGNGNEQEHTIRFRLDDRKLTWEIGVVHAREKIELSYVCTVNTDELEGKDQIKNTVTTSSGKSDTDDIEVDYPLELEKEVEQDTGVIWGDKTIFDYTVSIENEKEHPSEKDNLELTDQMPSGMLPVDCALIQHQTIGNDTIEKEITWEDFVERRYDQNGNSTFTAVIGGREAKVEKTWQGVKLTWWIGKLEPGEKLAITYRAQITLTEDQKKEGGEYAFTNEVRVDGLHKSVTVYGGNAVGQLYLEKHFDGQIIWNTSKIEEEWKNITFELTGIDAEGNAITFQDGTQKQTVKFEDFNNVDSGKWSHIFKGLPAGIYTITETNAEIPGKIRTTTYQVDADHNVEGEADKAEVKEREQTQVIIDNTYGTGSFVDVQKSVWALKKETVQNGTVEWSDLWEKKLFALEAGENNLVIYNMTVINTGSEKVHLDTLIDELPEELTYIGICSNSWSLWKKREAFEQEIFTDNWGQISSYDGAKLAANVNVTAEEEEQNRKVIFSFDKESGGYALESGQAVTFLMLCEVNNSVKEGKPITNTTKLVVDEEVGYKDYEEIETAYTPYDKNQNNGSSKEEGVKNGKRIISSSVTILPENTIVPGIAKKAVSYIVPEKTEEIPLNEESNIQPDSTVKWEITLYNDGTKDFTDYSVEDIVTESFHLITREEAQEKKIDMPYRLEIFSYDGTSQGVIDLSTEVWNNIGRDAKISNHTFEFNGENFSIPAGGYAKLTLYTNNTVENYKMYKNTATLIPKNDFDANQVKHGELKKDSDGKYIGVTASDEVNALGDFASVSWKTIAEKNQESNCTRGTQEKNYISVELDSQYVTYTNNIKNVSGKDFSGFVVIDSMPGSNDVGVINQNDVRGSEFTVDYAGGLEVYVLENGVKTPVTGYTVEFSENTSFTQADFNGEAGSDWHQEWQEKDRSFRVRLPEGFVLKTFQTLVIKYDGRLGADAKPGAVAWNSFGYQYFSGTHGTPMKAEPPKVGVMIPKAPMIQKEVVDSAGKVQKYDADKKFTFELWEVDGDKKLCEFTVCQGGYVEIYGLEDENGNRIRLENGKEYSITESQDKMPEGYRFIGIGEKGGDLNEAYCFTYYENKDILIYARNEVNTWQEQLPETGGTGTNVYTAGGALLMLASILLYGYRMRRKRGRRGEVLHLKVSENI